MGRLNIYNILIFSFLLSFSGCSLDSLNDPVIVADIENEFYIDLWETLGNISDFQLVIETIVDEECLNVPIDFDLLKRPNDFKVTLNEIVVPSDCNPGSAPATASVSLGNLPIGAYSFSINLKNTVNNVGLLTVTPNQYLLEMETEHGFILVRSQLLRIPDHTIWGYVNFVADQSDLAAAFIEELKTLTAPKNFLRGYYGHFTINNEVNNITVTDQPIDFTLTSFIHSYTDEERDAIEGLITSYRDQGLTIWMRNELGEAF